MSYGTENCFNAVDTTYISVAMLDATHFVVAYGWSYLSYYRGRAKIGTISGSTITYGNAVEFYAASINSVSVAALDSTHFVIAYEIAAGNGRAIVGSVSGATITFGSSSTFNSVESEYISVAALDSTHFVVTYKDAGGDSYGIARIGLVSGTTISSYGAENVFNSAITVHTSVTALDSTHFAVTYRTDGATQGYVRIGVISGTTISSYGTVSTFATSVYSASISIDTLDSTHFIVGYRSSASNMGVRIGLVSGTTVSSYGTVSSFVADGSRIVGAFDESSFVVAYSRASAGYSRIGLATGTTIDEIGDESVFNSVVTGYISVAALDSNDFVVAYKDDGGADYGCARVWQGAVGNALWYYNMLKRRNS